MSKRPKKAGSVPSRNWLRWPIGRLRDMPIWSKLGIIMIVPTLATAVVGTTGLIDHLEALHAADRAGELAHLVEYSGELVDDLQNERAGAVLLLGASTDADKKRYGEQYTRLHTEVDQAAAPYSRQRAELTDLPENLDSQLDQIEQNLTGLSGTRSQVINGRLRLSEAAQSYEGLISDLLDIRDSATQLAGDTNLSERMRAAAATARLKDYQSGQRIVVHRAIIQNGFPPVLRNDFIATLTGQQQALQSFKAVASPAEDEFFEQTVAGSDQRELDTYTGWLRGLSTDSLAGAPFDADKWDQAALGNAKLIRTVEAHLDAETVRKADQLRVEVQRQVFLETGLLLGMLMLSILFAWLVARSMARSLRELRQGALSVAQLGLPQAVARLRDPQLAAQQLSPVQLANRIAEPLPVRGKDEFGQVTEAFNAVHLEAVRTAAEQAALRASVATMFVNLARRSQILVDRLIGHLDRLERGEEDPDRLGELFQLDHLATRMRRNDENLLVLAGADSTRVQREPAALVDVLRAAQSEVEHYTRIEFGVIDREIEVAAHAVNDLVHLVAELFDNATAFSPPDSHIMVETRRVGDRATLQVEDRGIGISAEQLKELNERLATPPMVDVAVSRMMGLVVVARLAARNGVKVELRPAAERGTVAEVTLPASILAPRGLANRAGQHGGMSAPVGPGRSLARGGFPTVGTAPHAEAAGAPLMPRAAERSGQAALAGGGLVPGASSPVPAAGGLVPAASSPVPAVGGRQPLTVWSNLAAPSNPPGSLFQPSSGNPRPEDTNGRPATTSNPDVPRQVSASTEVHPATGKPLPPFRPPVAAPTAETATPTAETATPAAARPRVSLDLTTELPRLTPTGDGQTPSTATVAASAAVRQPYADETMELPIFRELESVWFRTRRPAEGGGVAARPSAAPFPAIPPSPAGAPAAVPPVRPPAAPVGGRQGQRIPVGIDHQADPQPPTGTTGGAAMPNMPPTSGDNQVGSPPPPDPAIPRGMSTTQSWQTAADAGWRAASAASTVTPSETTPTGLPKRTPMAQLVPGGVEKPAVSVQRRTPEAVRGLLSAYHRGVQRGRGSNPSDGQKTGPEEIPGRQSSQSGLDPKVGGGQKEHEG